MNKLPDNTWLTANYCNRFCGILIVDGKYVKVKGYKQKIPFIYGIDYLTHDIPVGILVPAESEEAFKKFFRLLKTCNYPLKVVVSDDTKSLLPSLKYYYPKSYLQLCHTHYVENIRQKLHVRTREYHRHFFNSLNKHVLKDFKNMFKLDKALHHVLTKRAKTHPLRQSIVMETHKRRKYLFVYKKIPHCPNTTNLIELYNSHIQARLKSIKGFQSFEGAQRWLNAYVLRRRTKKFTDCKSKFKSLNGKCSFELTIKKQAQWPTIFGLQAPKTER
jgi:transposase-like protein